MIQDILDTHCCCQVDHRITRAHQLQDFVIVQYRIDSYEEPFPICRVLLERTEILKGTRREVVNDVDLVPTLKIGFRQMGPDKTCTASDEHSHTRSST